MRVPADSRTLTSLVPCGHTSCLKCLQSWFTTIDPDAHPDDIHPVAARRKKTCPQCRTSVTHRPVPNFLIKDFAVQLEHCLNPGNEVPSDGDDAADPWRNIFAPQYRDMNRADDGAIIDLNDGGVRRCSLCLFEIYGGYCAGCNLRYDSDEPSEYDEDGEEHDERGIEDGAISMEDLYEEADYDGSFIDDGDQDDVGSMLNPLQIDFPYLSGAR